MDEEVDFEADTPHLVVRKPTHLGDPSLIVDNLHVTYRVLGGKRVGPPPTRLQRLMNRSTGHVGSVVEIKAVQGVSFMARHGEAIGIVGRNGSGKSTLLRAVAGLIPPTRGAVYVSGEPSLLGVNAALMSDLTGEKNIMIGGLALGLSPAQIRERFDDIVEFADIGDFVYLPMKAYSSGMQARLRFAISTAAVPDVLMIDEALATGDAEFRARSAERVAQIVENAGTIFLVSHSLASIRSMCTRALWIDKGILKMDGPVDDVCDAYSASSQPKGKSAKSSPVGAASATGENPTVAPASR
ncbi:ABC transporter ATP-binding protein [Angustibacter sp. McL0619]|uniref:ABC transporter ATP-binding protein n=1 Tax=Angustibacter sp. McL0619 TaxID=3415676 RepID=UPI003CE80245